MSRAGLSAFLAFSVIMNAFCVPVPLHRKRDLSDNAIEDNERGLYNGRGDTEEAGVVHVSNNVSLPPEVIANVFDDPPPAVASTNSAAIDNGPVSIPLPEDDDDDDDDFEPMEPSSTGGGSNLISLLNIATSLFPGSNGNTVWIRNIIKYLIANNLHYANPIAMRILKRMDVKKNAIEIDDTNTKSVHVNRADADTSESTDESSSEESNESKTSEEDDNNAAEKSVEVKTSAEKNSKQTDSDEGSENESSDSDYDSDEPPGGGDGQGGGILGILAGLSGGDEGSDLGSLLAAVGGIVANLSGDGFDLNSLIASGLGLFVGLLSEGAENPGAVVASYLLTSLDTITGGGAQNNGAFFGTFLSKLIKGTSAMLDEEGEVNTEGGSDSAGFIGSLLMGLLGSMSKGSS